MMNGNPKQNPKEESTCICNDTGNRFCRIITDVMSAHGVEDVICSPGSRNAPLLLAVAARVDAFRTHVVIDERSAAFMALGIAQVSRKPVGLICTSGTALLNYAPAVAEAYYQGIPLVVISADRPEQWIDQDDSQTIRQNGALSNFVKRSYDLPAIGTYDAEMDWFANRVANDAMIEALSSRMGPVHLNVRLSPPLGATETHQNDRTRIIGMLEGESVPGREAMNKLALEALESKLMIVAGFLPPSARLNRAIKSLEEMDGVVVLAETISNLHLPSECYCIDSVLARNPEVFKSEAAPYIVVSVGGAIVSRKVKEYLRGMKDVTHWAVGKQHTTVDCFQSLSLRIEADPSEFFTQLAGRMKHLVKKGVSKPMIPKNFKGIWKRAGFKALQEAREAVESAPWSDLKAYSRILDSLSPSTNLFLSNGTSVRYAQILSSRLPHASYCNRGVSGIDGSTSTAVGGAISYKGGLTVLLTGDMSFSYDIGALQLRDVPDTMRIIVIANGGGGIFRYITSTSAIQPEDIRERFFCADPGLKIGSVAAAFGWNYLMADSYDSLETALISLLSPSAGKTILEVRTPSRISAEALSHFI